MLEHLPYQSGIVTRQISAENPSGEKGGGAQWAPNPEDPNLYHSDKAVKLGQGWKVRPFIRVKAGETITLADIDGMGAITEFFFTTNYPRMSEMVLRFYWDDEEFPSVEVPAGAFFCIGHDSHPHTVFSDPVTVIPYRGCNSYWYMPFRNHARITLTHEGSTDADVVAYRVLYHLKEIPLDAAYFHAQYRHTLTTEKLPEHVILDGVKGKGLYVGTYLCWNALSTGWWGEGEVKFYLDGDEEFPSLCDNGTEDYFGGAWNFGYDPFRSGAPEQPFNSPYLGMPLAMTNNPHGCKKFSLYRWHIRDCIGFEQDIRATVQTLGWWPDMKTYRPLCEDVSSVAYYYQYEPHEKFPELAPMTARWER